MIFTQFEQNFLDQGRKEGLDQGRKEGLDQGRKEGLDQGKKEGIEIGRDEKEKEIIMDMLLNGISPERISELTKIPLDKVHNIDIELKK